MTITGKYKTYRTVGYTYQIPGSSPMSTGGVHHHQIRKTRNGMVHRIVQTNGWHADCTIGTPATPDQIAMAKMAAD